MHFGKLNNVARNKVLNFMVTGSRWIFNIFFFGLKLIVVTFLCNFSGGEQRRLSFGVALFHDSKIMILDEPTVGIDPVIRQRYLLDNRFFFLSLL